MLLRKVDLPKGQDGKWSVRRFTVSEVESKLSALQGMQSGRSVGPGTYTALHRGGTMVMSDTSDEMRDHVSIANHATGHVLIAGLGLGMVLQAVLDKPSVERATVIEIAPEVIRLVGPTYRERYGARVEIIEADIFDWTPPKGVRYGAAWFDIWNNMCTDNLAQMSKLKRRFARRCDWQGCWSEAHCRRRKRHEAKQDYVYKLFASSLRKG